MTANRNLLEIARSSSLHSAPMAHGLEQQGSKQGENALAGTCKHATAVCVWSFHMQFHPGWVTEITVLYYGTSIADQHHLCRGVLSGKACHKILREHRFPQTLVSVDARGHTARRSHAVPCDVQQARWSCSPASPISFSYMMP